VGSRPTKVVCITVLAGNRMGWTVRCGRPPLLLPSCRKLEFRLSALIDSDLAWVNGKSGRQSWCYADAFQRCIISEAIYHFYHFKCFVNVTYVMNYTGDSVPIRMYLANYPLTPTMRSVEDRFSVKYYINLVITDIDDNRYFKQQVDMHSSRLVVWVNNSWRSLWILRQLFTILHCVYFCSFEHRFWAFRQHFVIEYIVLINSMIVRCPLIWFSICRIRIDELRLL